MTFEDDHHEKENIFKKVRRFWKDQREPLVVGIVAGVITSFCVSLLFFVVQYVIDKHKPPVSVEAPTKFELAYNGDFGALGSVFEGRLSGPTSKVLNDITCEVRFPEGRSLISDFEADDKCSRITFRMQAEPFPRDPDTGKLPPDNAVTPLPLEISIMDKAGKEIGYVKEIITLNNYLGADVDTDKVRFKQGEQADVSAVLFGRALPDSYKCVWERGGGYKAFDVETLSKNGCHAKITFNPVSQIIRDIGYSGGNEKDSYLSADIFDSYGRVFAKAITDVTFVK